MLTKHKKESRQQKYSQAKEKLQQLEKERDLLARGSTERNALNRKVSNQNFLILDLQMDYAFDTLN